MGLDELKQTWLNWDMKTKGIKEILQAALADFFLEKKRSRRLSPEEVEYEAFSTSMRGQFLQLKEKGLQIRVSTF